MISPELKEKMKSEAEFGYFYMYQKISKNQAREFREENFIVTDSKEVNYYPRLHKISWEHAEVKGEIASLNENSEEYSFPQKLWITTMKFRQKE